MDVLVSMGTNASYLYSLISMLHHHIMVGASAFFGSGGCLFWGRNGVEAQKGGAVLPELKGGVTLLLRPRLHAAPPHQGWYAPDECSWLCLCLLECVQHYVSRTFLFRCPELAYL